MEVLTKKRRKPFPARAIITENANHKSIVSMTNGWQCCKCKETMYNDELYCTWDRCNHRRCSNCRSFTN